MASVVHTGEAGQEPTSEVAASVARVPRAPRRRSTAPPVPLSRPGGVHGEEGLDGIAENTVEVTARTGTADLALPPPAPARPTPASAAVAEVAAVAEPAPLEAPGPELDGTVQEVPVEPAPSGAPDLAPAAGGDRFRDLLGQPVGIRMDGVTRTYSSGDLRVDAVADVSLEIAPGEFVAIIGPSGCGKSTLLGLLGGLDRPTAGHVFAAGSALDQLPEDALADYRLQRVGTIFQAFNLVPTLSAADNVALPLLLAGVPAAERRARAERVLGLLGLAGRARFRPGRLSGGEQQRVAVARALAGRPGLVLADEPTGNLDSANGAQVLALLDDLHRRGATVVLVTHDPEVARRAGRVVRMRDGRIVGAAGPGRRTARAPMVLEAPRRLKPLDALGFGVDGVLRRPLRSGLTAAGSALGMGLTCLILSLATSTNLGRGVNFLAALALLAAGFGIVTTMYTSVHDRRREIGVLKALGARLRDVSLVFVAEAALIGASAGLVGAALAGWLARVGNQVAGSDAFRVTPQIALAAVLLSIALSLVAGLLPAMRAARLDPTRALRYE